MRRIPPEMEAPGMKRRISNFILCMSVLLGCLPVSAQAVSGCFCEEKCAKENPNRSCPVCASEPCDCNGQDYGISPLLSGTYISGGSVSYCQSGTTVDVQGAGGKKTTYGNNGYAIATQNLGNASITVTPSFSNGGRYVKLAYTVANNTSAVISGKLGVHADVMIGGNDKATISVVTNSTGRAIGLKMLEGDTNNTQFNLYFAGTGGVTDANTYWIGYWNERQANCFTQTALSIYENADSGLAISWNVELAPWQSRTYSCIVGVGEAAAPPQWGGGNGERPLALEMTAEATKGNLKLHVTAKVKDASGVEDRLYYSVNGSADVQLGDAVTGNGQEQTITGEIDLTHKPDGTYKYLFWIVNSKGVTSEAVERTITIDNGRVSGDVSRPVCTQHAFETEWSWDADKHWHACSRVWCDERQELAEEQPHNWVSQGLNSENGNEIFQCTICQKQKEVPHSHSWGYSVAQDMPHVLTAKCGVSGCPYHSGIHLTLIASGGEYVASPYAASFGDGEVTAWLGAGLDVPEIQYRNKDGNDIDQAPTNRGSYTASISVSTSEGDVTAAKDFKITVATVAPPSIKSKPYNGETQTPTLDLSNTPYQFADGYENVTGTNVDSYTVKFQLKDTENYQWDASNGITTFQITQADNAWTTAPQITGWTYGNSANTPTYRAKFGDAVLVKYRPSTGTDEEYTTDVPANAGAYKVRFTVTGTTNYKELSTVIDLTIGRRPVTVATGIEAASKEYDGNTSAELNFTNVRFIGKLEDDTLTVSGSGTFANAEVGEGKKVTFSNLTLGGEDKDNYSLDTANSQALAWAAITKKSVTPQLRVTQRPYDGSTQAEVTAEIPPEAFLLDDNVTIEGIQGFFDSASAGAKKTVTVDSSQKVVSGSGAGHYEIIIPNTTEGSITKVPLTVTARDKTITYGDAPVDNGVEYRGFVDGESKDNLSGKLGYTFDYIQFGDVGTDYSITPGGLTSENYEITFNTGKLTVVPKSLAGTGVFAALERTAYAPTGNAIVPSVTVTDGNTVLEPGVDFTVAYSGNAPTATPATAVAAISGKGNYKDTLIRKFVISEAVAWIPALPATGNPDDLAVIGAYERAREAFDMLDEEQKALLGAGITAEYEEKLDVLFEALTDYKITKGNESRWSQNSVRSLTFTANGAYHKFTQVRIDGNVLSAAHYTAKSGSTIITLSASYLQTLSIGKHTIQVDYADGTTDVAYFIINPPSIIPMTSDTSHILLIGVILLLSAAGLSGMLAIKKRVFYQPKYRKKSSRRG